MAARAANYVRHIAVHWRRAVVDGEPYSIWWTPVGFVPEAAILTCPIAPNTSVGARVVPGAVIAISSAVRAR